MIAELQINFIFLWLISRKLKLPLAMKLKTLSNGLLHVRQDGLVPQLDEPSSTPGHVVNGARHEGREADEGVGAARVALHDLVEVDVNPGQPVND